MHVWKKVFHTDATIDEQQGEVTRTILSLPFNGQEQDVDAMLQLYDDPETLLFDKPDDNSDDKPEESGKLDDKKESRRTINEASDDNRDDKRTIILEYIRNHGDVKTDDLVKFLGSSATRVKVLLYQLVADGFIEPLGANSNRTYRIKVEEKPH